MEHFKQLLDQFHSKYLPKIHEVYEIFKDYYTEDRVDLIKPSEDLLLSTMNEYQSSYNLNSATELTPEIDAGLNIIFLNDRYKFAILIHFPHVVISNEKGNKHDIYDLYSKVVIDYDGTISSFGFNRATYTEAEIRATYMHSHVCGINMSDPTSFYSGCLGDGPIRSTVANLSVSSDPLFWQLFCFELDKYTQVESLRGGPHRRMENIEAASYITDTYSEFKTLGLSYTREQDYLHAFLTKLIIQNKLIKFNFNGETYGLAESMQTVITKITNFIAEEIKTNIELVELLNKILMSVGVQPSLIPNKKTWLNAGILQKVIFSNLKLNILTVFDTSVIQDNEPIICFFKGTPIKRKIIYDYQRTDAPNLIWNFYQISRIIYTLLMLINNGYNKHTTPTYTTSISASNSFSTTDRHLYSEYL